ncbi:MAG: carbohydrate ABC transporter permease [Acidimicrobiia bacterium]|nr:carbohydrate ABC transporter permease [Acidimicrobiia bacterium]MDX2468414.1 carbohydrate ABC transporter permease [Acidimicrobiia bacterium]
MTATTKTPVVVPTEIKESRFLKLPIYLTVGIVALLWTIPTLGLLINSFREARSIRSDGWWAILGNLFNSATWSLENYRVVLEEGFGNAFVNTVAVTIPSVVIPITIAAFAAYAFSWMKFPGRNVMFVTVVGLMVVPLQMALIPILRIYVDFNVNGTFPAAWLAHAGFGLPLAVYLLRNYMGSLPASLMESANIDGADHFTIFYRLVIPLSVPVLASFAIFQFLWVWNDYLVALVFLGIEPNARVLTVELADLAGRGEGALSLLPAAAFVTMILPMVVFFSLQRFFVRGLTAGSVKG